MTFADYSWGDVDQWRKLTYSFGVGYKINRRNSANFIYANETYFGFYQLNAPFTNNKDNFLVGTNIEGGENYLFKYIYSLPYKKFKFNISAAYVYSISIGYRDGSLGSSFYVQSDFFDKNGPVTLIDQFVKFDRYQEYGIRQHWHSIDGRIGLEYQPCKWWSIDAGMGYAKGLNTIGYFDVRYKITGYPEQHAIMGLKGTNYYYFVEMKIYPFANLDEKKLMKKVLQKRDWRKILKGDNE
ncbi:MAG: hypothetical protein ACOYOA_11040 [Saprospiraceae bacterium]